MEVLHDLDCRVKITTAITKKPSKMIRSIFVNDTDLVSGRLNNGMSDRDKIIADIQKNYRLLGRLFEIYWWIWPDKLFIYIIDFKFKSNREFTFIPTTDIDEVLQVRDEFDVRQPLQIIDPSMGKETLSIHIALDRNMKDQYLALEKKV